MKHVEVIYRMRWNKMEQRVFHFSIIKYDKSKSLIPSWMNL